LSVSIALTLALLIISWIIVLLFSSLSAQAPFEIKVIEIGKIKTKYSRSLILNLL
jgi:hypothetical protein